MSEYFRPERLIEVREKLKINKADAARMLDMSKMGYGRYESGERVPSVQVIEIIAQKLGTSVDYLTGKSDDPDADQIVVSRRDEPELFAFAEYYKHNEEEAKLRIEHYLKSLKDKSRKL